jgi:uncharacterized protein YcsI (UPF0317 family)
MRFSMSKISSLPLEIRQICRFKKLDTPTHGLAELPITHSPGYMFISDLKDEPLT